MTHQNAFEYLRAAGLAFVLSLLAACGTATDTGADRAAVAERDGAPAIAAGSPATVESFGGALAMPDRFSAEVVEAVLAQGGNAVDAAIAAAFVLAVTLPEAGNIGGGGFMLIHHDGEQSFLDYRETAPAAAGRDLYLDEQGEIIEDASVVGHLAAGVPGTVAGLWEAHRRFGTRPWAELVEPAVALAARGFPVPEDLARYVADDGSPFAGRTNFTDYFGSARAGENFVQPELAATLQRIAANGAEEFYRGETARLLVAEMTANGGLITAADLDGYRAVWREPLRARWRTFEVVSAPPPSSGGFGVIQLLKMKAYLDETFEGAEINSARYVHLVAEMQKRVFADRAEYLGDSDFFEVPIESLLTDAYIARRAREVNPIGISRLDDARPGLAEGNHTTHFSIVDARGNAVANTYTLNTSFGSGVVVRGAGFLLNNEMDDFSAKPGVPNYYGVVGNEANAIAPGKRPLSSMSPTLLLEDGRVRMAVGTPGGSTIFGSVFQTIAAIVDGGKTVAAAVGQARFHHQLLPPDLITYTASVPLETQVVTELGAMGYRVEPHAWEFGDLQAVWFDGASWQAASDPRQRGMSRVLYREGATR
jgi:gamma-glutamyltranspeptidase / glutathione hydrolase